MRYRWILGSTALVAMCALSALPTGALAQTSRVEGMALQGDYIKDYTGIYTYPSGVASVGNLIYGELGNFLVNSNTDFDGSPLTPGHPITTDRSVGAVLGNLWDGRYGVWGIHLREETPALGQGDAFSQPNPGAGGFDPNDNTNESIDLMWGRKAGTTSIGLRFNRSFFKSKDQIPGITSTIVEFDPFSAFNNGGDPNLSRNITGIGGGVGFEMNPNTNIELSVLYQHRSFEASTTVPAPGTSTRSEEDQPTTFMLAGRAMWQWQPNVMVVPVVKWYSFDLSNKTTTTAATTTVTTFDNTLRGWQIGAAGNWTLGTNDLFVLGVTIAQNRVEQQYDIFGLSAANGLGDSLEVTETIAPQVFAALETHVNNWLTLRFGANKGAYQKVEAKDVGFLAEKVETNLSPFQMNLGVGVKLGTLQLDAILNDTFPQTLGGLFSNTANYVAFPKVTATYTF